jgi:BirA family biotin operon repressor/biotin-[acetyl-CoA-carboxylase] ligase
MHPMTNQLSPLKIVSLCGSAARRVEVRVVAETGSTNADLLAGIGALRGPTLLIAEKQTAGRGRAGRAWHSAPGASLTFSLAWKFNLPLRALVGLPLAVGVGIAETLRAFEVDARLKWPNDILFDGRKLGGILIESAAAAGMPHEAVWAIAGVGLNRALPDSIAARIDRPVTSLAAIGSPGAASAHADPNRLMAALLTSLAEVMTQFEAHGLPAFVPRWNALHAYAGRSVVIVDNGEAVHEGSAVGIDETGRLLIDTAAGRVEVMAGDVSLRVREE